VHAGLRAKDVAKPGAGPLDLAPGPGRIFLLDVVLPAHVIESMDAHFEPVALHAAHHLGAALTDVRAGQQRTVKQSAEPVVRYHGSAPYFLEEALAEHALDGAAGMVGPQAEQKGGAGLVLLQYLDEARHALAGAAVGVDVDLQRQVQNRNLNANAQRAQKTQKTQKKIDMEVRPIPARCAPHPATPLLWRLLRSLA